MPLQSAVVKRGATSASVVGGSDVTFTPDGQAVGNGIHIADSSQTDFRIRQNMTIKNKVPTLLGDGTYSKDRKTISIVAPKILADGTTVFNLIRIEREVHPESTAAEAFELLMLAAQAVSDSDFLSFWSSGSLA
jgi:hypothetical protein